MKLSVLIPVYNEEETIEKVLNMIKEVPIVKEIIIVDDGSVAATKKILSKIDDQGDRAIKIIYRKKNSGKGAALRTGFDYISGDAVIIQDADLEYTPADYLRLVSLIEKEGAEVVYGSRFLTRKHNRISLHYLANYFLTGLTNILYGSGLTDIETCYKLFKSEVIKKLNLESDGFEVEAEITGKLLRMGYRIFEVPVSYERRSYNQGKKITWRDGIRTMLALFKYRLISKV